MHNFAVGILLASTLGVASAHGSHHPAWKAYRVDDVRVWARVVEHSADKDYLFALRSPRDVRLIVSLSRSNGHPKAVIYSGSKAIEYRVNDGQVTVSVLPYAVMTDQTSSWETDDRPNYDIKILTHSSGAGLPAGILNETSISHGDNGIPEWEVQSLGGALNPTSGYNRFDATQRMKDAPPFITEDSSIPKFPYLSVGGTNVCQLYVCTPTPLYFDVRTRALAVSPVVGFENAGNYRINSLTYPPKVDFESPFAFYNFLPHSRYSQLIVRAENYPAGDPFGFSSGEEPSPRMSFRYSWVGDNPDLWDYSLDVAGGFSFKKNYHIGPVTIKGVGPNKLPDWVIGKRWPVETFVQAMHGYSGSEGIYFDTTQVPQTWPWLTGIANSPPSYLSKPSLQSKAVLTDGAGLPIGFRGDYTAVATKSPKLYVSPIDDLVHLVGAQGGVWNLGHHKIVREENLTGGKYFDAWVLEKLPKKAKAATGGKVLQSIYAISPYLVYMNGDQIVIKMASESLSDFTLTPPTNRETWLSFRRKVAPYQTGRNPNNLSSWLSGFGGVTSVLNHAIVVSSPRIQDNDFSLVMHLTHRTYLALQMPGLAVTEIDSNGIRSKGKSLQPGTYVLNYNAHSGWTIRVATLPVIQVNVSVKNRIRSLRSNVLKISVANRGTSEWYGTVSISVGHNELDRETGWIDGSSTKTFSVNWSPKSSGRQRLVIRADQKVVDTQAVFVAETSRGTVWSLWPLSIPEDHVLDGIIEVLVGILIVGGSVVTWRRLTLG